ncbi:MAG: hypothetical protein Q8928_07725 [Bacteroidota bacterium]|nr:hypothetical protein [Bacteroidota bacterium]
MVYCIPFHSTKYHDALPDILKVYDKILGLWPKASEYATGTIGSVKTRPSNAT